MSKKVRWIITAVVAVLLIVALKTAGVFIDFFVAFCYGGVRLGFYIFRTGTRGIARIHAEEQDKLARQRQEQYQQPQYAQPQYGPPQVAQPQYPQPQQYPPQQ